MEATSLDEAIAAMVAPEATEDNQSEAAEASTEPTQDVERELVEAADESYDDVEASDDGDDYADAEIDDEDQVEATEDTNLFPVKINGKDENWTLDQLKQSAAGQGYINQKMQENAALEKRNQQQAQALAQQQQKVLALYQQAQQGGLQAPVPPSDEGYSEDPIGYMEAKIKFDKEQGQYNQKMHQLQAMHQQQAQTNQAAHQAYLAEQADVLKKYLPEIADPEKGEKLKSGIMETGQFYGFTPAELAGVADARYVRALNDARKYRELVRNKQQTQAKGDGKRPVVKAGGKKRPDAQSATRKKQHKRLQEFGGDADAVALMLKP